MNLAYIHTCVRETCCANSTSDIPIQYASRQCITVAFLATAGHSEFSFCFISVHVWAFVTKSACDLH